MNKSGREKLNLFFSAFLVVGYIVCAYFFTTLTNRVTDSVAALINVSVFALFGLILFYATRVGEGVPVKRFSPIILFVLVVPSFIILLAALLPAFPLHAVIAETEAVWILASIALGYGIPYTFLSGFEMIEEAEEIDEVVEGGLAQELLETEETEDEAEELSETEETVDETEELSDEVADEQDIQELEAIDGVEDTQAE